jgi:hypothetical protein
MDPQPLRIENGSHYGRDVAFAEDASRIRKNRGIAALLRSFAHNVIRASGGDNRPNTAGAAVDVGIILKMTGIAVNETALRVTPPNCAFSKGPANSTCPVSS